MDDRDDLSRREFLKASTLIGVGLVISIYLPGCQSDPESEIVVGDKIPSSLPDDSNSRLEPSAYLRINNRGEVTIIVHRSEMGQGVRTALPMLIAEELDVAWDTIRVEQATGDSKFGIQTTGGSTSISDNFLSFRRAGAAARYMILAAAAQLWDVDPDSCKTENGIVIHPSSGNQLAYGELVEATSQVPIPLINQYNLKDPKDFKVIGTSVERVDSPQFVTGQATYASDIQIPGMLHAVVARCPVFGGRLESYDSAKTETISGVREVIEISSGVAIVAESTWAAIEGRRALQISWNEGTNNNLSTEEIRQALTYKAGEPTPNEKILDLIYEIPFLPHLTMEPMNCVADVRSEWCEVWAPTQSPQEAKSRLRSMTRLNTDDITVHVPLIGGGFGRRLEVDYVLEAAEISQTVGAPIKLTWTRDDDIQHDYFHPFTFQRVIIDLDNPQLPRARSYEVGSGVPTGAWRSVFNMPGSFAQESAIDEMAVALGIDPYEMRIKLEPASHLEVIQLAATKAEWGTPLPDRWGRGMACFATFNATPVVMVAEIFIDDNRKIHVHKVVCAIDCGTVVNPNIVEAQMEGGIVYGMTAALKDTISIMNGRVEQSNFHECQLLHIDEMPKIEVYIVESDQAPSGVGEMAVPPIIPAIANAIYDATGIRLRRLPFEPQDLVSY